MIICRMVLPITFVRKWRKEEEPARGFIAPQGINSSVPAPISLSRKERRPPMAPLPSRLLRSAAICLTAMMLLPLPLMAPEIYYLAFSPCGYKVSHRI